ncbi:MAG: hypothetical protein H7329_18395 [Opitutaceae bacterium]|nr:hypothetical protein [Cytophagales bacterium]
MINIQWNVLSSHYLRYNQDAWKLIGGKVYENHKRNPIGFGNSCTIRVSRALTYSGIKIPFGIDKTISGQDKN